MSANEKASVSLDGTGRLVYDLDERGNRIPDFSNCGFMGGGVVLPEVDAVEVLLPLESGDDTRRIQAAINHVAAIPEDEDGYKGAVLLKHGVYRINKSIHILSSGVVLRGEGQGEDGTTLVATGKGHRTLIEVGSVRTTAPRGLEQLGHSEAEDAEETRTDILDEIVPVGSRTFRVANVDAFSVGDEIIVHRPSTEAWIRAIGMDRIEAKENTRQWEPGSYDMHFRREVVEIDGNQVTVDAPLVQVIEEQFGGGSIYKYIDLGRIERVGVENLRGISEFDDSILDEDDDLEF